MQGFRLSKLRMLKTEKSVMQLSYSLSGVMSSENIELDSSQVQNTNTSFSFSEFVVGC